VIDLFAQNKPNLASSVKEALIKPKGFD